MKTIEQLEHEFFRWGFAGSFAEYVYKYFQNKIIDHEDGEKQAIVTIEGLHEMLQETRKDFYDLSKSYNERGYALNGYVDRNSILLKEIKDLREMCARLHSSLWKRYL